MAAVTAAVLCLTLLLAQPGHAQQASSLRVENPTAGKVDIFSYPPDGTAPVLLGSVDGGFFLDVPVTAGSAIGFATGGQWIGGSYAATAEAAQIVTLPLPVPAVTSPAIGNGSVSVRIENPSAGPLRIHHVLADRSAAPFLTEIAAGFYLDLPAEPDAIIAVSDASGWVGSTYVVDASPGQVIQIPLMATPPAPVVPTLGDGSAAVRVENPTSEPISVHHILPDGTDAPQVGSVPAGTAFEIRAQAGVMLGFSHGQDWSAGTHLVTGAQPEVVVLPVAAEPALPGRAGDGSVVLRIVNPSAEIMGVQIVPEDGSEPQLVASIDAGGTLELPAQPGLRLGFSPGGDWYGGPYTVGQDATQDITLPLPMSFSVGSGSIPVDIENIDTRDLIVYRIGENESEPVGIIPAGKRVVLRADPDMRFGFSAGGLYLGGPLVVSRELIQSATVPLPLSAGTGSAVVAASNPTGRDLTVFVVAGDAASAPTLVGMLGKGETVSINADPGVSLGFGDETGQIGGTFVVPGPGRHGATVPLPFRNGDGSVRAVVTNLGAEVLNMSTVDGEAAGFIGTLRPGESVPIAVSPCTMLGFASATTNDWVGGMVQVTREGGQQLQVPTAQDSDLAKCALLTTTQVEAVLARIAVDQARMREEEKSRARLCWRDTYGRGVGTIPTTCPAGKEERAGLCYDKCRPGFRDFVTMCVPTCPAGFQDTGLHCLKPGPVVRSAFAWKLGDKPFSLDDARARCARSADGRRYGCGTFNSNTIVYSQCPTGYKTAPVATSLCTPVCPSGTTDIGVSCQKNTYDRGVGRPKVCAPGLQADAGLCYASCSQGYAGVGPVCWNACPRKLPVNCGAACAASKNDCATIVADQVTGPIIAAANITLIAVTAGAASGATAAGNAAKAGAKTSAQLATKAVSRQLAMAQLRQRVAAALTKAATGAVTRAVAQDVALDIAISTVISGAMYGSMSETMKQATRKQIRDAFDTRYKTGGEIDPKVVDAAVSAAMEGAEQTNPAADFPWTSLDPTGIADIVVAYNHPICSDIRD